MRVKSESFHTLWTHSRLYIPIIFRFALNDLSCLSWMNIATSAATSFFSNFHEPPKPVISRTNCPKQRPDSFYVGKLGYLESLLLFLLLVLLLLELELVAVVLLWMTHFMMYPENPTTIFSIAPLLFRLVFGASDKKRIARSQDSWCFSLGLHLLTSQRNMIAHIFGGQYEHIPMPKKNNPT